MTTRTVYEVICDCGHVGRIKRSENDQPYSKPYENYELEELSGSSGLSLEGCTDWEKVFEKLKPSCPKCGKKLAPSNVKGKL